MDETPEFIEMMRKATEIQNEWKPKEGDYWVKGGPQPEEDGEIMLIPEQYEVKHTDFKTHKAAWLPRQDQLQNMLDFGGIGWWTRHNAMEQFVRTHVNSNMNNILRVKSMEQLWLMLVMKHNHNKTWNGNDWVPIKGE